MALTVTCRCGKWFAAPDHLAGTTAACPSCGSPIAIGAQAQAPRQPAQAPAQPVQAAAAKMQPAAAGLVVTCACGKSYKAPENLRGQSLPCPACGRAIPIPGAAAPQAPANPYGFDPLASDPLADPLMSASLTGAALGAAPAYDPLGRPMASAQHGGPTLGQPMKRQTATDDPNWILIGSIGGGVALVLLILVGLIIATNMSGNSGTPVAANTTPSASTDPATTTPPAASSPARPSAIPGSTTPATSSATSPMPGVSGAPGTTSPGVATSGVATPTGAATSPAGTATTSATPTFGPMSAPGAGAPGIAATGPGTGGSAPPAGAPGTRPTSAAPAGSSAPGGGRTPAGGSSSPAGSSAAGQTGKMVRIVPRKDPKGAYDTLESVTPNLKGFSAGLATWHGDSRAKLAGVFRIGDDPREMTQAHYSWMHNLLPFMGHQDIYDKFDLTKPLHDDHNMKFGCILVPEFLVPGNPKQRWEGYPFEHFALTHFVGMSGIEDARNVVAGKFDRSDPRAGIFGYDRIATQAEIKDGTSNTIMVIGVGDLANPWVMGGGATIRGARQPYFDKLSGFGSHGQQGAITMMADGSVRLISKDVDPAVFRAMCTMHGAESVDLQAAAPVFKTE